MNKADEFVKWYLEHLPTKKLSNDIEINFTIEENKELTVLCNKVYKDSCLLVFSMSFKSKISKKLFSKHICFRNVSEMIDFVLNLSIDYPNIDSKFIIFHNILWELIRKKLK